MLTRIEVSPRSGVRDVVGEGVARKIRSELALAADSVRVVKVFTVQGLEDKDVQAVVDAQALHDPVLHRISTTPLDEDGFDWALEVGFRPGVTDNEGRTAQATLNMVLGRGDVRVYTSQRYHISGALSREEAASIAKDLLANELIQRYELASREEWDKSPGFAPFAAQVTGASVSEVATIPIGDMTDAELAAFSRENTLALSLAEMHEIQSYFSDPSVAARRAAAKAPAQPTDAEMEALAQTWSEHCKHKIFNAKIHYRNQENGRSEIVDSLFKTCIQDSTKRIREAKGEKDFCLSVFKDNAGVIKIDDELSACIKVETHNSPSALDPYGGALTGIVGVNRDPMGTGLGANLLCNTDVFCFASPFFEGELPPRLLHPRRVFEGVREGVEHGGNKSGVPTVNGSILFDERYLGKPLVYCGTVGTMPAAVQGRPSHEKAALPGDYIVMAGGRIGKDGIHGATFSSEELHEHSPATAVQIGDPITQRRMYDCLMRARDLGLYNAITDNGAGGLSSSVGEMAQDPGGCDLDLAKAPLKYDGLRPWEILVSEAQERMTLAVPPERIDAFLDLAKEMGVEATVLGTFNDSGVFHVRYGEKLVTWLDMDFLHEGAPQMELSAVWERPKVEASALPSDLDHKNLLRRMLGRLNICSKAYVIRQYDHEVQGGSVIKPLVGVLRDGPGDAGVLRPKLESEAGLVLSHGICPRYGDLDAYWMMALAIDEAVRNAVAVGGDIDYMAGVDNFCWCDPVASEANPDGAYKLAQLVRANRALAHFCTAYGVPCISGKDSMKNDYKGGGKTISIPPTVLFSCLGVIPDVRKAMSSDFKHPGDLIYVLGRTLPELGKSEAADELGLSFPEPPQVDALANRRLYRAVHQAAGRGLITACHDLSDGGLAVALAEMAIGGRLGCNVDLQKAPASPAQLHPLELLYSESAGRLIATVRPENKTAFEACITGCAAACLGSVTSNADVTLRVGETTIVEDEVLSVAKAFQSTLDW
ncbi:MAG: AIR synthase-related protein [Desulfovibrionaceae bacterium]